MPKNPANPYSDGKDWDRAWTAVRRLAEARENIVNDRSPLAQFAQASPTLAANSRQLSSSEAVQLQRDLDEIERAAAALRRAEPNLESLPPHTNNAPRHSAPQLTWLLISIIWACATLVVVTVIGAIRSLL
jgi:hypothetical protein